MVVFAAVYHTVRWRGPNGRVRGWYVPGAGCKGPGAYLGSRPLKRPHENRGDALDSALSILATPKTVHMGYVYSGRGAISSLIAMPSARSAVCVGPMARRLLETWNV